MILRPLRVEDEREADRAHAQLSLDDFPFLFDYEIGDDLAAYVERTDAFNRGGAW